ncbi:uncharacterized [Tachysurus ichikawai]
MFWQPGFPVAVNALATRIPSGCQCSGKPDAQWLSMLWQPGCPVAVNALATRIPSDCQCSGNPDSQCCTLIYGASDQQHSNNSTL